MSTKNEVFKSEAAHLEEAAFSAGYVPGTDAERKLVRRIDMRLLPMLWVMYILNYLDRTNIGNAKVAGMQTDLKLTSNDYATALSVFFVGYLLNEIPSNLVLTRSRPSIFLPCIMLLWGSITIAFMGIHDLGALIAVRFILGCIEAGFFPGVMFLMSCWYKPFEMGKRMALFYTASLMAGAFGGVLGGAITSGMEGVGGVRGWHWLFGIEGIATVVVASLAFFVLPDFPHNTKFLTGEERALAVLRLVTAEGSKPRLSHKEAFMSAVKNWHTWLLTVSYMGISGSGTISYFFPTLMLSLGYTGTMANYMTAPIYAAALVVSVCVGYSSDHFNEKPFHVLGATIIAGISFIITATVPNDAVKYTFILFGGCGIWSAVPLCLSYCLANFKNNETRAVAIAIINGLGNTASIYGAYIWPANSAPSFTLGFACTTAFVLFGGICTVINRFCVGDLSLRTQAQDDEDEEARNAHQKGAEGKAVHDDAASV
ncbi:major facilitator superfamily transporter [Mrakia frigida]|uniref:major facilitator superfamily transporter n=1 Tax=Mrakia frigida TaxID=29902 RepID=UPI003FCC219E